MGWGRRDALEGPERNVRDDGVERVSECYVETNSLEGCDVEARNASCPTRQLWHCTRQGGCLSLFSRGEDVFFMGLWGMLNLEIKEVVG